MTDVNIATLKPTQESIRDARNLWNMVEFIRGRFWTEETRVDYPRFDGCDSAIFIARFPDGALFIRDGHHRTLAAFLSGRSELRGDEYIVEDFTYEMWGELNLAKTFATPLDPRTEVRVADFWAFKKKALAIYNQLGEAEAERYIRKNKHMYCRPRTIFTIAELAERLRLPNPS